MSKARTNARAIADVTGGIILGTVDIAAPPERVFRALTSDEVTRWWGSDGTYRTTAWEAEVRVGGSYRAGGVGQDGRPFSVRGEYLEVDPPRRLVQTWEPDWEAGQVTKLTYALESTATGTRLTIRHDGFGDRAESCRAHGAGWEMVLGWLDAHTSGPRAAGERHYVVKLVPPRASFMADMSDAEKRTMMAHVQYWTDLMNSGHAVVFGPVLDPVWPHGLGVLVAKDDAELAALLERDPALLGGHGLRHEIAPMAQAVVRP
jgi:uncharacterized protein YndB with AHSA1/START domain